MNRGGCVGRGGRERSGSSGRSDDAEVFGEGGSYGMDFLGSFVVSKGKDKGASRGIGSHAVGDVAFKRFHAGWRGNGFMG